MRYRVISWILVCVFSTVLSAQTQRLLDTSESAAVASPRQGGDNPSNTDLFSQFAAALQSYAESGGQALTFDYKIPGLGPRLAGKAQLVLRQPKLNEKFAAALSGQTEQITLLEKDLGFGDDVSFVLTIAPSATKAEKQLEKAAATAEFELFQLTVGDVSGAPTTEAQAMRSLIQPAALPMVGTGDPNQFEYFDMLLREEVPIQPLSIDPSDPAPLAAAMAATRQMANVTAARKVVEDITKTMAVLAVNQSKFKFDASFRDRQDMVGPDEWFVKSSYEWGVGTNIAKRLDRAGEKACADKYRSVTSDATCASAYADALKAAADDGDVKMGTRFTFSLEFKEFSKVNLTQPVAFELKGSRSLVASATWGRDLLATQDVEKRGRIELSLAYDDVRDDNDPSKTRKDRLIGKLTYSQRINEKLDIPITLTYANHDDYLTDVDKKLNAHFGISYKLPDLTKKN